MSNKLDELMALARRLPLGKRRRVHCCSTSGKKTALVSHTVGPDGTDMYGVHCFRCEHSKWESSRPVSAREFLAQVEAAQAAACTPEYTEPHDATRDLSQWSLPAKLWCLKHGVPMHYARDCGLAFVPRYNRILIPLVGGGCALRRLDDIGPKYIQMPAGDRQRLYTPTKEYGNNRIAIVVEDALSAIKVRYALNSRRMFDDLIRVVALNGTTLSERALVDVDYRGYKQQDMSPSRVLLWLDNDAAGTLGAMSTKRRLELFGHEMIADVTGSMPEPKLCSVDQINTTIFGLLNGY